MQVLKERADFDNYKPRPFNMREFYDRTGHDIKDMLLSCYYRGAECSPDFFKVVSCACRRFDVLARWGVFSTRAYEVSIARVKQNNLIPENLVPSGCEVPSVHFPFFPPRE